MCINLIVKSNTQLNANITKIMLDKKTNISKWLCLKIIAQLQKKYLNLLFLFYYTQKCDYKILLLKIYLKNIILIFWNLNLFLI